MKTLLAVLMIAVSAWGQTAKCIGDHCTFNRTYCNSGFHTTNMARVGNDYTFQCEQDKPKPHKPKPSVKPHPCTRASIVGSDGDCGELRNQMVEDQVVYRAEPCDGFACTKPVACSAEDTSPCVAYICEAITETSIETVYGSKIVKLSDSEYSHLQQLRAAVVEEEKRLAVKYGAKVELGCVWINTSTSGSGATFCDQVYSPGDHYEYHGQFLLIEKGK